MKYSFCYTILWLAQTKSPSLFWKTCEQLLSGRRTTKSLSSHEEEVINSTWLHYYYYYDDLVSESPLQITIRHGKGRKAPTKNRQKYINKKLFRPLYLLLFSWITFYGLCSIFNFYFKKYDGQPFHFPQLPCAIVEVLLLSFMSFTFRGIIWRK